VDGLAPLSPVFSEISELRVTWTPWGERLAVVRGTISPWHNVIHLANIALFLFVADAAVSLWRRGGRRQAAWMAGGIAGVFLVAVLQDQLLDVGFERIPYMLTFLYLVMVPALGYSLTASVVREMEMARRLQASEAGLLESQNRALRAAADAERAEERFRLVVEGASSAMVMVGPEGRITLVNARTEAVFGYPREELIGVPVETLIPGGLRSQAPDDPGIQSEELETGAPGARRELSGRRKNGEEVPLEAGLTSIRSSEGVFTLASILDITDRKRSELELARQRDEMAHLSRAAILGELSGSLAHELNQPLSAILSNAQAAQRFMARDPSNLDEVREILKDIVEQDKHAGEVIRRLRLLLTKGEVNLQTLDLNGVVLDVAKLVRNDLAHQGVTMSTDLAPDLPLVRGDRVQVQQVLLNLVMNGCDAMADVEIPQRLLAVRAGRNGGGFVQVSVADRGCGISPEEFGRLFEPFFTTKSNGLGLGLAVCRSIVEAHEGRLWAESGPGAGATFHFTLPAAGDAA
jgi:PAS domain S-box-containing protein